MSCLPKRECSCIIGSNAYGMCGREPVRLDAIPTDCSERLFKRDHGSEGHMNDNFDDLQLIKRIAGGDQTAVRLLLARYKRRVFGFIVRLVRNDAVAEELTNEVFLEVWRGAKKFEGRSSATTWIMSIAHNRSVSVLRKRREENWDEEDARQIPDESDDPETTAQKTDKGELLQKLLETLSPMHREVIELVYYHELSLSEVSEVIGVPSATAKTRLFKARKRLGEKLQAAGVDRGWP